MFSVLQLYTQDFYRDIVKSKLSPGGIFVTQSGPAGVLSSTEVFTAIHKTLQSVFPAVVPYAQHIPSYNDAWVRKVRPLQAVSSQLYADTVINLPAWIVQFSQLSHSFWLDLAFLTPVFDSCGKLPFHGRSCKTNKGLHNVQGFNMAVQDADMQLPASPRELDTLLQQRIVGQLKVILTAPIMCSSS